MKHAAKVMQITLLALIALTIIKAFAGYVTNIIALTGDAIGSFSDIIAASALFVGLKFSQKQPSETFKYGYHRVETFITLCISIMILYAGYEIFTESFNRFFTQASTSSHEIGIAAALFSIIISFATYYYQKSTGKQINSTALMASADEKRNDIFASFGVMGGVVADKFKIPYVESTVGLMLSVFIILNGLKYGKEALLYLLDYWDEPKITNKIRAILKKSKIVTEVTKIRLRHAGTYIFGEVFLKINPFTDSKDLRDEIHRLDREIENTVEHLGDLVLYVDPPKPTLVRVAIPISRENGLRSHIAENPGNPFNFFFVEIKNGAIQKFYGRPETFSINKVSEIAAFLKKEKTNILISSLIRPLLYYNLRLNNIKVYPHFLEVKDVENTVKLLMLDI